MSCGSGICGGAARFPLQSGVSNTLGFITQAVNTACCPFPCPSFPLHKVSICVRINALTCIKFQTGCGIPGTGPVCDYDIKWSWDTTQDTWGRSCRVVHFERTVPDGAFVRFRLCRCDPCADDNDATDVYVPNVLLKFQIDGVDYRAFLDALSQREDPVQGCVQAQYTAGDMQPGDYAIVGPIGSVSPVLIPIVA